MYTKMQCDIAWSLFAEAVKQQKLVDEMEYRWSAMKKQSSIRNKIMNDIRNGISHGNVYIRDVNNKLFEE